MEHEKEYLRICDELKSLVEKTGEPLEGNCMYRHNSFEAWDCLVNKRKNYQTLAKSGQKICEIGFNAGHSFLAMVLSNPNAEYVLFDLGFHSYSKLCFEYLRKSFPNVKMKMVWGDSRNTLPDYYKNNPKEKFDIIHIDGSHKQEVYSTDWENSLKLSHKGTYLVFDDTDNKKISTFLDSEIEKGNVLEAKNFLETFGYEHRILVKQ